MPTTIRVYTTTNCQGCRITKRWLDQRGVEYETRQIDLPLESAARDVEALKALGYTSAPVVIVQNGTDDPPIHWAGFDPGRLEAHCTPKEPQP